MGELVRLDRGPTRGPGRAPTRGRGAGRTGDRGVEPLWRELTGDQLRRRRLDRGETLATSAARAGVSTQYLSELERGLKDPSSEILAAVAGALGLTLLDLTAAVSQELGAPVQHQPTRPRGPVVLAA